MIEIFLCGDVMTGRGIDQILPHPCDPKLHERYVASAIDYVRLAEDANGSIPRPVDFSYIWGDAVDEWRRMRPHVRIVNLETAVTRSESYVEKGINYRMSPENVGCLLAAGIDCCVLANNHVLDWGTTGLIDTLAALERHRMKTAGAGRNESQASAPAVLEVAGRGRVLVFAFASESSGVPADWAATRDDPGVNLLPGFSETAADEIGAQVGRIRKPGDVVIVSIHWGTNWGFEIPDRQRRFAHALIDRANVSVVHGHSSHHPKAIEVYKNRLVLYGCGDFLNDYEGIKGYEEFRGDLALMYFAGFDGDNAELVQLEATPLRIQRLQLARASSMDVDWLLTTLDREGRRFGVRVVRPKVDGRLAITWPRAIS